MSDDDYDVIPGAALADPELRATLGGWRGKADEAAVIRTVLTRFPWQEYQYKYGRWQWVDRLFDFGFPLKKWARTYDTVLLLDPVSAQPAGELNAERLKLRKYSGTVRFAGDPRVGGVLSAAGTDLQLAVTQFVSRGEAVGQLRVLRPGAAPPPEFTRYLRERPDENRPWVADQPAKPRKPA
jgi:hypothetical protein